MQSPQASRLRIPSEDSVPLFDPSGLSASLSNHDWNTSFDLSSFAAARLGITSPASDASPTASIGQFRRSPSQHSSTPAATTLSIDPSLSKPSNPSLTTHPGSSGVTGQPQTSIDLDQSIQADHQDGKRGRRRRSSELVEEQAMPTHAKQENTTSVGSKVRMWWERNNEADPQPDQDSLAFDNKPSSDHIKQSILPPLTPSPASGSITAGESPIPISSQNLRQPTLYTKLGSRAYQPETGATQSPNSPSSFTTSLRSPAAEFLSTFSNPNSGLDSPASVTSPLGDRLRSTSFSPPNSTHPSLASSLMADDRRNPSSPLDSNSGGHGLTSAAAHLYLNLGSTPMSHDQIGGFSPRLDDQGARVGPSGRYLLGKTIGFGGFSTVRQGWDLEAEASADPTALPVDGQEPQGHKIAIKIVYKDDKAEQPSAAKNHDHNRTDSHELGIWKRLPAHPHLLPLLHHEIVTLSQAQPEEHGNNRAELLVMPYCDQGSLLDYVRSEGGSRSVPMVANADKAFTVETRPNSGVSEFGSFSKSGLSRSTSLNNSLSGHETFTPRSGSGFTSRVQRSHNLGRVASSSGSWQRSLNNQFKMSLVSTASSPGSNAASLSGSSVLLRQGSNRGPRSQGLPIEAAREIMRQLASALYALHINAKVLHSDLKLENILGQGQTSSWKAYRKAGWQKREALMEAATEQISHPSPTPHYPESLTSSVNSDEGDGLFPVENAMPCWRVADFGLAHRMDEPEALKRRPVHGPALLKSLKEGVMSGTGFQKSRARPPAGRGGSLAYTAPEFLRADSSTSGAPTPLDDPQEYVSPFVADMWALGCILYALLSGRLPFSDSFEPRLQMKIAKAQWEYPTRLRRRAERLAAPGGSQQLRSRSASSSLGVDLDTSNRFSFVSLRGKPLTGTGHPESGSPIDLSSSLPSMPPNGRPTSFIKLFEATNTHSDRVVGSAPGRPNNLARMEINQEAKALADVEVDPESDDDETVDPAWDGLSKDRAGAREVLQGLLQPNPSKRWTIETLCSCEWLRDESQPIAGILAHKSSGFTPSYISTGSTTRPSEAVTSDTSIVCNQTESESTTSLLGQSVPETPAVGGEMADSAFNFKKQRGSSRDTQTGGGKRTSSLARTRPADWLDNPSHSPSTGGFKSTTSEVELGTEEMASSISRSISRDPSEGRTKSGVPSESSTPSREHGWLPSHMTQGIIFSPHQPYRPGLTRPDSPADSERRGRHMRPRMADLNENETWKADEDETATSRYHDWACGQLMTAPIPIRSKSQSRSRSSHSRDSSSPEPFYRRSLSKPRSVYSVSHDPGPSGLLYGRSLEAGLGSVIQADLTHAQRTSTSRSRSRAPEALAQILGMKRATSRSRGTPDDLHRRVSMYSLSSVDHGGSEDMSASIVSTDAEREQETRGRARDRKT